MKNCRRIGSERRWLSRQLNVIFGEIGLELGHKAEVLVHESLEKRKTTSEGLPDWLNSWHWNAHNSIMDRRGVDYTFATDVGKIYLQVKSSEARARIFRRTHGGEIVVVVIDTRHSLEKIYAIVMHEVAQKRNRILKPQPVTA